MQTLGQTLAIHSLRQSRKTGAPQGCFHADTLGAARACVHGKGVKQKHPVPDFLQTAEISLGEFLLPWGMVVSALGFLAAWLATAVLEHFGLTRFLWNLPLFFIALSVLLGSVFGLVLAP